MIQDAMKPLALWVEWMPSQLMRSRGFAQTGTPGVPQILEALKSYSPPSPQQAFCAVAASKPVYVHTQTIKELN